MQLVDTLPEAQRLALAYAPVGVRPAWLGLMALDVRLSGIVSQAREPMLGQIRLAWWRDLLSLDPASWPEGEPLVRHIADHLREVASDLAALATGWEYLLSSEVLGEEQLSGYLSARASAYAAVATYVSGAGHGGGPGAAARWWVLGDTFSQLSRPEERQHLLDLARTGERSTHRLARAQRPLAILAALGARAIRRREPVLEGRASALLALRVGMFGS